MSTIGFTGYAPGAIKSRAELTDLIAEAGKTKRAIRLYAVEQGGHQSNLFLTSKSRVQIRSYDSGWQYEFMSVWQEAYWQKTDRFYRSERSLADLNIAGKVKSGGHNCHQLFRNKRCADEYAEKLRNDARYQQAVKDHHRRVSRFFNDIGW